MTYKASSYENRTENKPVPVPYATGSVVKYKNTNLDSEHYMILGHIWWNCEQTFAYYRVQCDAEGNPMDVAPDYSWCHNAVEVVSEPQEVAA